MTQKEKNIEKKIKKFDFFRKKVLTNPISYAIIFKYAAG